MYANVKEGKIVFTGACPRSTEKISNFYLLPDEDKKQHGWYKVTEDPISIKPFEKVEAIEYDLVDNNVIQTKIVSQIPLEEFKQTKKNELKQTFQELQLEGYESSQEIKLDCRESDKINWVTVRITALETPEGTTNIKDYDNILHFNKINSEVVDLMNELLVYYQKLYDNKWLLEQTIDNSNDYNAINDIYWRKAIYSEDEMEFSHWEYNPLVGE